MKSIIGILVILIASAAVIAQPRSATPAQPDNSGLESEMRAITREMHDLLGRGEKEKLFSYFAEDFVGTTPEGVTVTKDDLIKHFQTPPAEAKISRDIQDFKARGNTESAVVNYRVIEHVEIGEDKHDNEFLYTDTFIKRDGRWQMLASQATRVEHEPKLATINPKIYDAYVGHYSASPTLIFTVVRQGDKLIGEAPDGTRVELLPESETTFFIRGRSVRTTFLKDERGQVTHMMIGLTKMKKVD